MGVLFVWRGLLWGDGGFLGRGAMGEMAEGVAEAGSRGFGKYIQRQVFICGTALVIYIAF